MDFSGQADSAGQRHLLQTRGNVHPVAEDVSVLLDDDVAEIDPDPQLERLDSLSTRDLGNRFLKIDGTANRFDGARELAQEAIPDGFHQATMMRTDSRFDDLPPQISETAERSFLVFGHEI
jgi:hypothetical protein